MQNPKEATPIENTKMPAQQTRQIGLLTGVATVRFPTDFSMTDEDLLDASHSSKEVEEGRIGN